MIFDSSFETKKALFRNSLPNLYFKFNHYLKRISDKKINVNRIALKNIL